MQQNEHARAAANGGPIANSVTEASRRMGVSKGTLYNLVNAGQLRTITIGTRRLIPETELQRYVELRLEGCA